MTTPGRVPSRPWEFDAAAWELEGALGLPFVVRENGDLALEPDALDEWWARRGKAVMDGYRQSREYDAERYAEWEAQQ